MDKIVGLGGGLEMLVINSIDFAKEQEATGIVREGEDLQRLVFTEQGVSFPDKRVLLAEDSAGTPKKPGSLDGSSSTYHHLYLLHQRKLIGMRVTEEVDVQGLGCVVLEYLPPLVPAAEASKTYNVKAAAIMKKEDFPGVLGKSAVMPLNPVQALMRFSRHLTQPLDAYAATVNDCIGVSRRHLQQNGYLMSEVGIWVPPMDAQTREEYLTILEEPVHMFARFSQGAEPRLGKDAAEWLFVQKYLKEGYIDKGQLRRLGLRINELPCVVRTREAIAEAAGKRGHVAFRPIS